MSVMSQALQTSERVKLLKPTHNHPMSKGVVLSRTESLALWHRVTLRSVRRDSPDLTTRQLAVLMIVYLETGPHTVRSLAKTLDVTKAVITRAVNCLVKFDYVQRAPDLRDKRSITLTRTSSGIHYLRDFADIIQTELPHNMCETNFS